jgi:hypothetical protein
VRERDDDASPSLLERVSTVLSSSERHPAGTTAILAGGISIVGTILTIFGLLGTGFLDYGGLKAKVEYGDRDRHQLAMRVDRLEGQGWGGEIAVLKERLAIQTSQISGLVGQIGSLQNSMNAVQVDLREQLRQIDAQLQRLGEPVPEGRGGR